MRCIVSSRLEFPRDRPSHYINVWQGGAKKQRGSGMGGASARSEKADTRAAADATAPAAAEPKKVRKTSSSGDVGAGGEGNHDLMGVQRGSTA